MNALITDPVLDTFPTLTGAIPPDRDNRILAGNHSPHRNIILASPGLGFSHKDENELRRVVLRSGRVHYEHAAASHYTEESPQRWSGIDQMLRAINGGYPPYADCSSSYTWWHWDGSGWLRQKGLGDYVNGLNWAAGYTGTMTQHGRPVSSFAALKTCDAVFYGGTPEIPGHVAMKIDAERVLSNGSEAGPLILPWNYRPDVVAFRQYIY